MAQVGAAGPAEGPRIGDYRLDGPLSRSRSGDVFLATHLPSGRQAAIRLLPATLSQNPQFTSRFPYEARAVGLVRDPGLCEILEFGLTADNQAYLVMELLIGDTLSVALHQGGGRFGVSEAVGVARHVARALARAHGEGVGHGALRPDRVILARGPDPQEPPRIKIIGAGLVRLLGCGGDFDYYAGVQGAEALYLAPELLLPPAQRGDPGDRADVYAVGALLYQLISGRPPLEAPSLEALRALHQRGAAAPLLNEFDPMVPEEVSALVGRMLAPAAGSRPSLAEAAQRLDALDEDPRVSGPRTSMLQRLTSGRTAALRSQPGRATQAWAAAVVQQRAEVRKRARGARGPADPRFAWLMGVLGVIAVAAVLGGGSAVLIKRWRAAKPPVPAAPPDLAPAPPSVVRWSLQSDPSGAKVVRVGDGIVLGRTPWQQEQPAEPGSLLVALRLDGYAEHLVRLDRSKSSEQSEKLVPDHPTTSSDEEVRPPRKGKGAGKGKTRTPGKPKGKKKKKKRSGQ